jgi:hypothetical protein
VSDDIQNVKQMGEVPGLHAFGIEAVLALAVLK